MSLFETAALEVESIRNWQVSHKELAGESRRTWQVSLGEPGK